jgi:hypothetical protein
VQTAAGLVDDLGRRVHAIALRERQFLADDGGRLGRRDLEDEVDGGAQIQVEFGGHDALHRSILACRRMVRPLVDAHCRRPFAIDRSVAYPQRMRAFRSPSRRRRAWVLPVVALGVAAPSARHCGGRGHR